MSNGAFSQGFQQRWPSVEFGEQGHPELTYIPDTAEQVKISSLALLKMLKHCRAGVPFEVMGVLMGEFVDEYTVEIVDVFAMPQLATTVSVEAVDPAYQARMFEMLKVVGRKHICVGWYHSHPGFGCWLSMVDVTTQRSFEQLSGRCVAVVIDPIQSVRGMVVMDAFRSMHMNNIAMNTEPRISTSNQYYTKAKPSREARIRGLNRLYYNMTINASTADPLDIKMLKNLQH
jgi:26S proteasome regulatory subunit N11